MRPRCPPQYDKPVSGGPQDVGDSPINVGDSFELDVADVLCGGGAAMDCAPTNNPAEKGLTPDALRVMRCITETFGERPWANVGDRPSGVDRDHQEGRAVDAMMTEGDDDYRTPPPAEPRAMRSQISSSRTLMHWASSTSSGTRKSGREARMR